MRALANPNLTKKEAAAVAGVPERTARLWVANGAPPQKRGRKASTDDIRTQRMIKLAETVKTRKGRSIPLYPTAPRIAAGLKKLFNVKISRWTVSRCLKKAGYKSKIRPKHPAVNNTAKRFAFAKVWVHRDPSNVTFSDEHWINVNDNSNPRMIVKKGQKPLVRSRQRVQNVSRFHLWGAVGVGWRSNLIFFPKHDPDKGNKKGEKKVGYRLTAKRYIDTVLKNTAVKRRICVKKRVFMHDGASSHTAGVTKKWLRDNKVNFMKDFPAHSPDLNPIESVWAQMNTIIAEQMPTNDRELIAAARYAWRTIPQRDIDNHVNRFKTVCQRLVETKGL